MKKLVLIAFVCTAMAFTASAQTEKGTWLLGGTAGFTSQGDLSYWNVSPDLGYFIKDKWALGGRASIDGYDNGVDNTTSWTFKAFVRPYFGESEMGKFFVDARVGFDNMGSTADTELTYGGGVGYAMFLNRSIALEFGAGYDKTGDFDGKIAASVGFQIHFKK